MVVGAVGLMSRGFMNTLSSTEIQGREALEEALALDGLVTLTTIAGPHRDAVENARAELVARLGIIDAPPFATAAGSPGR